MVFFAPDGDSPAAFNLSATGKFVDFTRQPGNNSGSCEENMF